MANADKGKQVLGMPASQGTGAGLGPLTPAAKLSVAAGSKRSSTPLSKSCNKRPATKVAAPTGAQPYLTGRVISSLVVTSKNQSRSNSLEFVSRADGRVHHIHTSPPKEAVSVVKRGLGPGGCSNLVAGRLLNDLERGVELRLPPAATESLAAGVRGPKPAPVPCDAGIPNTCLPLSAFAMLILQAAKPLPVLALIQQLRIAICHFREAAVPAVAFSDSLAWKEATVEFRATTLPQQVYA
ncbi:hypothetical protein WJX77_006629 [Trebouxia sp. C0004]